MMAVICALESLKNVFLKKGYKQKCIMHKIKSSFYDNSCTTPNIMFDWKGKFNYYGNVMQNSKLENIEESKIKSGERV